MLSVVLLVIKNQTTSFIHRLKIDGYVLIDDQVWCEAQHVAIALLVRPPAQAEGHEEEPGALQQGHLVIQM